MITNYSLYHPIIHGSMTDDHELLLAPREPEEEEQQVRDQLGMDGGFSQDSWWSIKYEPLTILSLYLGFAPKQVALLSMGSNQRAKKMLYPV